MRHDEMEGLAPQVCQLAIEAGRTIMEVYEGSGFGEARLDDKSDASPLTLADLASNGVICNGLRQLTPDVPVVSEEDSGSLVYRLPSGNFWLIDPLDGTKEFLARNGEFTVNIALIKEGEPVWGVVHAPATGQTYWGGRAWGAFRQEGGQVNTIRVSSPPADGLSFRVVASKSHLNAETLAFIRQLGTVDLIQAGSSLKFCRVAEGSADVYPRLSPTCEWDTAAAQAVVEGAGGYVFDTEGFSLRYGKHDLLNPSFIASSVPFGKLGRKP